MTNQFILCIDDTPIRYSKLAVDSINFNMIVLVSCRLEDVMFYLKHYNEYPLAGICLDHDMPGFDDGMYYARHVLSEKNIPVAITSMNSHGANNIQNILNEYAVPNYLIPADDNKFENKILNYFLLLQKQDYINSVIDR